MSATPNTQSPSSPAIRAGLFATRLLALVAATAFGTAPLLATDHFVDLDATGSGTGASWANAWTDFSQVGGLSPGDTVYVSGGPSGQSRTYEFNSYWAKVAAGSSSAQITYKIGQDSSHNGTAILDNIDTNGTDTLINFTDYITVTGDAGDGACHFKLTGNWSGFFRADNAVPYHTLHFSYIDYEPTYATTNGHTIFFVDLQMEAGGLEIDHCYINPQQDHHAQYAIYVNTDTADGLPSTWDQILIHDNEIDMPTNGGDGGDCIKADGTGFSIYNNRITGIYDAGYLNSDPNDSSYSPEHQDGVQLTGADSDIKIYGNSFLNIGNYPVFGDGIYGGFNGMHVYNNVCGFTNSTIAGTTAPQAIAIGPDHGIKVPSATSSDILVYNNTVADYNGSGPAIHVGVPDSQTPSHFSGCEVFNNVLVNSQGISTDPTGITTGTNTSVTASSAETTSTSASAYFSYYQPLSASNDFHLAPSSPLIGAGTDESSTFTTDKDGVARSDPWSLGAYVYVDSGAPTISSSTSSNAVVGTSYSYTITGTNNPTSYGASNLPFGLSLSGNTISGTPTQGGVWNSSISASNGSGTGTATLTITVNSAPVITSPTTATATLNTWFNYDGIFATYNPTSFNATNLPPGISVDTQTGGITGTPTQTGTWNVTISATNAYGTGSAVLTLTVTN